VNLLIRDEILQTDSATWLVAYVAIWVFRDFQYLNIRWDNVQSIDKAYLLKTLPVLDPIQLTCLKYIGVDEVARAKSHDYITVIYDMVGGKLIRLETGFMADVFSQFLK
jgi:hypothetical protein